MEIKDLEKCRIITLLSPKLTEKVTDRLKEELDFSEDKRIGIDMSYVKDCTIDFIDGLNKNRNISLFNIPSDIFAILISMGLDKTFNLFVSESDFLENKHQLLNRKFSIVH